MKQPGYITAIILMTATGIVTVQAIDISNGRSKIAQACNEIASIMSLDSSILPKRRLCSDEIIKIDPDVNARIFCDTGRAVIINGAIERKPADICSSVKLKGLPNCTASEQINCIIQSELIKGGQDKNSPLLLEPYGKVQIETRPSFVWQNVEGADEYRIEIIGVELRWERFVKTAYMDYPVQELPLKNGSTYKINIVALKGRKTINTSVSSIAILSDKNSKEMNHLLNEMSKVNPNKLYVQKNNIFLKFKLVEESRKLLKKRINEHPDDVIARRLLAELYLRINDIDKSEIAYMGCWGVSTKTKQQGRTSKN